MSAKDEMWAKFAKDYPNAAKAWLMGTNLDVHLKRPEFLKYVHEWDCDRDEHEWLRCSKEPCSICGVISDDTKAYEHRTTGKQYCSSHARDVIE